MSKESIYRMRSRAVIAKVMTATKGKPLEEIRAELRKAYPFQQKIGWAYRMWCAEQRRALEPFELKEKEKLAFKNGSEPRLTINSRKISMPRFPWIYVSCPWCFIATSGRGDVKGCIVCGPVFDELQAWLANPDFMGFLTGARADPQPFRLLIFADWIEERGENYGLADAIRRQANS